MANLNERLEVLRPGSAKAPLRERLEVLRADKAKLDELRAHFGYDHAYFNEAAREHTSVSFAQMIIDEIEQGVSHWYADNGYSKDEAIHIAKKFA